MCCALNSEVTFKDTFFGDLTREAQNNEVESRKVNASSGLRAGLSLVLDMHSDRASFGTLVDTSIAFSVFIGTPTEFPVLREDKIAIEPGKEHFLRLSGQVGQIKVDQKGSNLKVWDILDLLCHFCNCLPPSIQLNQVSGGLYLSGDFNIRHPAFGTKRPQMPLQGGGKP